MCGCEALYVCSRCAGDPKQDWRMAFVRDPAEDADDARYAGLRSPLEREVGITKAGR